MQSTITMGYTPAVRASRALRTVNVRKMCVRALSLARRKSITLAALSTVSCFAGVLIENVRFISYPKFGSVKKLYYLCSAIPTVISSPRRARLMLDISAGFFCARTYQPYTAVTDSLYTLLGVDYCGYRNGDSRSFFNRDTYSSMQEVLSIQGHAPAVSASSAIRTIDVRKMCVRALSLARRKSLTLAALSTVSCFAGVLIENDPLTCLSGAVALGFLRLADSTTKGGDI